MTDQHLQDSAADDPRNHDGNLIARWGGGYRILCRCGWQSAEWPHESQAEDEHDHHVAVTSFPGQT